MPGKIVKSSIPKRLSLLNGRIRFTVFICRLWPISLLLIASHLNGCRRSDEESGATGGKKAPGKYTKFWNNYGKPMKLGLIEDSSNRQRIAKLLRFTSSKSGKELTSFEEYIGRMKSTQKKIYYIIGK